MLAETLERARSGVDILKVLEKLEQMQRALATSNERCAELATHVRRLTEEKGQFGRIIFQKDRELEDFRQAINRGLEREADLKGRLLGLMAAKVEHVELAHPDRPATLELVKHTRAVLPYG